MRIRIYYHVLWLVRKFTRHSSRLIAMHFQRKKYHIEQYYLNSKNCSNIGAILHIATILLKILCFRVVSSCVVLLAKSALRSSVKSRAYSISQYRYCFDGKIIMISSIVAFSSCSLRCQKILLITIMYTNLNNDYTHKYDFRNCLRRGI